MSIRVGTVPSDLPFRTNPAPAAISILERLLLKPEPGMAANCSFFCWPESWEAAIRAKSNLSPSLGVPWLTVKLNWVILDGQLVGAPETMLQSSPVVEEAVTCHLLSEVLY